MNPYTKSILYLFFASLLAYSCDYKTLKTSNLGTPTETKDSIKIEAKPVLDWAKTKEKAAEALAHCKAQKLNTDFCILIDMSLHSGVKRFVLWDFTKDSITHLCQVAHGCGDSLWSYDFSKENPKFSNEEGSHCTSLGKYKIGKRAHSDWGIGVKYLLHGLESSNSNALKRLIVFHSWDQIPDSDKFPEGTPEGWGCPVISENSMRLLDEKLKKAEKGVLLWIYV